MRWRKWLCVWISVLAVSTLVFSASAAQTQIYAEPITSRAQGDVLCPVRIRGNPGLMGFKLTFLYDSEVLNAVSVQKGEVTQNGILNDSIGVSSAGSFETIWSHSTNVTADGVLLTLVFRAAEAVPDSTDIQIEVSQPDTFNETWNDVPLKCEPIRISFSEDTAPSSGTAPGAVTQDAVLSAVDRVLQKQGTDSVAQIPTGEQDAFLQAVNQDIQAATGSADYFTNMQAMTDAYTQAAKEAYLAQVQQSVDGDKILLSLSQALQTAEASSIEAIPADKQTVFIQTAEDKLAQYMVGAPTISARLDTENAMDALIELQERVAQDVDDSTPAPVDDEAVIRALDIGVCIAGAAILAAVAAVIYIKKKKSKSKEEV